MAWRSFDDAAATARNFDFHGTPPKKQGFVSRMQENFAVLKENDTVVRYSNGMVWRSASMFSNRAKWRAEAESAAVHHKTR